MSAVARIASRSARAMPRSFGTTARVDPLWGGEYDEDMVAFPSPPRAGLDIELNWSLARDGVTPAMNAYRNPSARAYAAHTSAGADGVVATSAKGAAGTHAGGAEAAHGAVADHLSNVTDVFVQDAAVGSHRGAELRVRAVTDCAALSVALRNLLVRVPKRDAHDPSAITVLAATGLAGESFISSDGAGKIVVGGQVDFGEIQAHIAAAAAALMEGGDAVPMACTASSAKGTVVFAGEPSAALAAGAAQLNGAHHHVWGEDGLSRMFGGASLDAKAAKAAQGDVVFDGARVVTRLAHAANLVAHPSKVVFVGDKAGKASAAEAGALFAASGASETAVEKFVARVEQHGTSVEVVKSAAAALKLL